MSPREIITDFYEAFRRRDVEAMIAHYHHEVRFEDPAFGRLVGRDAGDMWRMLISNLDGRPFELSYRDVAGDDQQASATWQATYTFSKTGREVTNIISANMKMEGGKIIEHIDVFDLRRWAGQALGWKGTLLGGTTFFKNKLQKQTKHTLQKWQDRHQHG